MAQTFFAIECVLEREDGDETWFPHRGLYTTEEAARKAIVADYLAKLDQENRKRAVLKQELIEAQPLERKEVTPKCVVFVGADYSWFIQQMGVVA